MRIIYLALGLLLLFSCENKTTFDIQKETVAILKLHHAQRDSHFNKDSLAFVNQFSKSFISVNKGEITQPSKKNMLQRYHRYFSSVTFDQWDDVSDPIIRFSEDGTLAYTIVDKLVKLHFKKEDGTSTPSETHFAWTTIYKKHHGRWKIDCVTSTERTP
ncbi:nuclear transport factor 2 family protein [Gaetbulibacter aestuarii]|uniref:Nuclear transport factor 2 family protein n=1 Tax=Gaetbulibacter aestuarii TaxID=1502358 RepID=A0ABW7MWC0_9FLAO